MQIYELLDKEFKITVIKMLNELNKTKQNHKYTTKWNQEKDVWTKWEYQQMIKSVKKGVPVRAQWLMNLTRTMRLRVWSLALLSGLTISVAMSCDIGRRCGLHPALLWLWCRLAATAPIRPLAWELPYAAGMALKSKLNKQTNKKLGYTRDY